MIKSLKTVLLTSVFLIGLFCVTNIIATTIRPYSIEELTRLSDLILTGEVVNQEVSLIDDFPYTTSTIDIHLIISGEFYEDKLIIVYKGGEVEDSLYSIKGIPQPHLKVGKRYLFFLKTTDEGYELSTINSNLEITGGYLDTYCENEEGVLTSKVVSLMDVILEIVKLK